MTFPGQAGWNLKENRITLTFRKWNPDTRKWQYDRVPFTFFKHREWTGDIQQITLKRDNCGDYWLCVTTNDMNTEILPTTGESVGADNVIQGMNLIYSQIKFGMKTFLTLNTGEKIASPEFLKRDMSKLRSLNKSVSRKKKGSGNWWRAVLALARFYRTEKVSSRN